MRFATANSIIQLSCLQLQAEHAVLCQSQSTGAQQLSRSRNRAGSDTREDRKAPKTSHRDTPAKGTPCPSPSLPPNNLQPSSNNCFQLFPAQLHKERQKMSQRRSTAKSTVQSHQSSPGHQHHENEMTNANKGTGPKERELIEQPEQNFTAHLPRDDESCDIHEERTGSCEYTSTTDFGKIKKKKSRRAYEQQNS